MYSNTDHVKNVEGEILTTGGDNTDHGKNAQGEILSTRGEIQREIL